MLGIIFLIKLHTSDVVDSILSRTSSYFTVISAMLDPSMVISVISASICSSSTRKVSPYTSRNSWLFGRSFSLSSFDNPGLLGVLNLLNGMSILSLINSICTQYSVVDVEGVETIVVVEGVEAIVVDPVEVGVETIVVVDTWVVVISVVVGSVVAVEN